MLATKLVPKHLPISHDSSQGAAPARPAGGAS